jgi:hypothetical protein
MFKQLIATALISVSLVPVLQLSARAGERCETYYEHDRHGSYKSKRCYKENETTIGEDLAVIGGLLILKGVLEAFDKPNEPEIIQPEHVNINNDTPAWYNLPNNRGGYSRRFCIIKQNEFFLTKKLFI